METIEKDMEKIKQIIDEERQKYAAFGGDIEYVDIQDGKLRIRPKGFCWR